MTVVTEGWENGPTTKRDLKKPAKLEKYNILTLVYWVVRLTLLVVSDLAINFGSFLWGLIFCPEPKSLKGRVCLVTGAGRGLGREFCLALAKEGAIIACADINESNNKTTAEMVKELGAKVVPYTVNVAIKKDVEELVSKVEKELGNIYLLINNAALVYLKANVDEEFIRAAFNINLFGAVWMMNAVLPSMEQKNEGHIVNIASVSSKMVVPNLEVYGATKISLAYMSNCLRAKLQLNDKNGVKVTTIHPFFVNTSEDYVRIPTFKLNLTLEMEDVVKATMDAIHYNYEDVIIPSITKYPLILLTEIMPTRTMTNLTKLCCDKVTMPNEEQERNLPWHDLIKKCSFIENVNEKN